MANQGHKTVENSCSILPFVVVAIVPFSPWRFTKGTCFDPKLPRSSWGEAGRCKARRSNNLAAQHPALHAQKKRWPWWQRSYFSTTNCVGWKNVDKFNVFGWGGLICQSNSCSFGWGNTGEALRSRNPQVMMTFRTSCPTTRSTPLRPYQ